MRQNTCCFTGHRILPNKKPESIVIQLNKEIDNLISQGVTTFLSGGALGFDQLAATIIISKRQQGANVKLNFILPCRDQDKKWTHRQKNLYSELLREADSIHYISEEYTGDCMKERNHYMVDSSRYCICAFKYEGSGTGQTVRYAEKRGLQVINVA